MVEPKALPHNPHPQNTDFERKKLEGNPMALGTRRRMREKMVYIGRCDDSMVGILAISPVEEPAP